jgi:porphobilinogen deaminase
MSDEACFCALVAAANSVGSRVVTDVLALSNDNNSPTIVRYENAQLAQGCMAGIRMIMSMMDISCAGAIGAYAITKGVHSIATVVGHTDEGSWMRTVLRQGKFCPSYGGVFHFRIRILVFLLHLEEL